MSTTSTIPLFGRVWSLLVQTADGQALLDISTSTGSDDDKALRITFDVRMHASIDLWEAKIQIFNLDPTTIGLITQGAQVSLSIGYEASGPPSEIFRGVVFQPLFERQNVTDFVLTLECMVGLQEITESIVSVNTGPVTNQWSVVQQMAKSAGINIAHIDDASAFSSQTTPRGKTIFGTLNQFLPEIIALNQMLVFTSADGLNIGKPVGDSSQPDLIFAPPLGAGQQPSSDEASITRSLINSPQQTENGVAFRVLGDPRIKVKLPLMQVKLDQTVIRQMPFNFGTAPKLGSILNQDGVYYAVMVNHLGDSRGNEWYTEVIGVSNVTDFFSIMGTSN